ncbi:MAG: ferrous iron transport protein B [Peptococcaceae bacterium]|nr:ferrous iron transport protein B [Peptococcaceae bacterium]
MKDLKIALVGNPNVGKSTVFNALTGSNQQVGNWAGKTVERKVGTVKRSDVNIELIDLPGTYSLTAYSQEEIITREYILRENPAAIMALVDASNLERNLYLVLQILELTPKVVIGLNMLDLARSSGRNIDAGKLAQWLKVPVVEIIAAKGDGLSDFLDAALVMAGTSPQAAISVNYPPAVEEKIVAMEDVLRPTVWAQRYPLRWLALKRLERDAELGKEWNSIANTNSVADATPACCDVGDAVTYELRSSTELPGEDLLQTFAASGWDHEQFEMAFADAKYSFISEIIAEFVTETPLAKPSLTDTLDRLALSPVWGYPILIAVLALVFWVSFIASAPLGDLISQGMTWLANMLVPILRLAHAPVLLQELVKNGIFAGVGAVLSFVPQMALFFVFFSLLQDSGYLARAAFLGDRFMQLMGLHGKSFFSLATSYGCNVPGIMATRTLEDPKDRLITMLLNPLIPCVPRLGVMSAVVAAFFPGSRGAVAMLSLLGISGITLVLSALFLRKSVIKTEKSSFVMELPLYHIPTLRNTLLPAWQKTYAFLRRAWTYIFAASVIIWSLSTFPLGVPLNQSFAGKLGGLLAFIGHPLGFDWRIMVAIIFGFAAKETTLSTLGILYGVTANASHTIAQVMTASMSSLNAFTFLVFYMLYIPCIATVVTTYKESGSLGWTLFGVGYNLIVSFIIAWLIFHGGLMLGWH